MSWYRLNVYATFKLCEISNQFSKLGRQDPQDVAGDVDHEAGDDRPSKSVRLPLTCKLERNDSLFYIFTLYEKD